jgi:hypothetical protein
LAGDLVDRGPDSKGVVEHALTGAAKGTHVSIAGNHEEFFLRALNSFRPDLIQAAGCQIPMWLETLPNMFSRRPHLERMAANSEWAVFHRLMWLTQGGAETLASYGCNAMDSASWCIPLAHVQFLCRLQLAWFDEAAVVTHALAEREDLKILARSGTLNRTAVMRILWSRSVPRQAPDPQRIHVSGHTPVKRVRRSLGGQVVRVDTGACLGGRLTAYCPSLDETLSVASSFDWRP